MDNYFAILNAINVNDKTEKKNGLTYLSWAWAWAEVKKLYPDATYTVYERDTEYGPVNYFTDGRTCWVKTGVTINSIEHIEELPVMDFKNRSIPLDAVNSMDVNKAIQRSLTKACARHGLGLYIYAGEDLPEDEQDDSKQKPKAKAKPEDTQIPMTKPGAQEEMPTPEELADLYELIPDEDSRRRTQEMYGEGFEKMTRKAYNAILAKCKRLKEAGA